MNQQTTNLQGLDATITAHREEGKSLVLVSLQAHESPDARPNPPMRVALVIDRSGSMSGEKLHITKAAVAQFVRSLGAEDRVSIVAYDDEVDLYCGLEAPSARLAAKVEEMEPGSWTNLYGGWLAGAKIVGRGGRVILLSDGLANRGRFTDAASLAAHAARSYQQYGVTTSTIGVGRDYDEALMAGMARAGGGAHYFAHEAASITEAFSQERYSAGAVVLQAVSVRIGAATQQFGHFWSGEAKRRVFAMESLAGPATVRYTVTDGQRIESVLRMPAEFGYSEDVRLEDLLQLAAEAEAAMVGVRDPISAAEMRNRLRAIVLDLLAHPSSDEPSVAATIDRLKASIGRLEQLSHLYVEEDATMHRKRSMQSSYNLQERAKAFTSFADERAFVAETARGGRTQTHQGMGLKKEAFALVPVETWIKWEVLPVDVTPRMVIVAMEDPRRGFLIAEIEKACRRHVKAVFAGKSGAEIVELLKKG